MLSHSLYKAENSHTDKVLHERPGRKPAFLFLGKESATMRIFLPPEVSAECAFTGKERAIDCVYEKKMIHGCQSERCHLPPGWQATNSAPTSALWG
jgi:hypothetical protein